MEFEVVWPSRQAPFGFALAELVSLWSRFRVGFAARAAAGAGWRRKSTSLHTERDPHSAADTESS
jgi:hypothetical protein